MNNSILILNRHYLLITILLFFIEVAIALYIKDSFIRPYFGDLLVVILLYCFLKSFLNLKILTSAIIVLTFSVIIEFLQYLNIIEILGLQNSSLAKTIIGTSFSWLDILTYFLGIAFVLFFEKQILKKKIT